jgi:hypothetical protein
MLESSRGKLEPEMGSQGSTTGFVGFRIWYGDDSQWEISKDNADEAVKKG